MHPFSRTWRSRAVITLAAVTLGACADYSATAPAAPDAEPAVAKNGATAYLTLSTLSPSAGDRLVVTLNTLRGGGTAAIGSFTLRLAYDTAGFRFVSTAGAGEGMVLGNATGGVVTVAGASSTGFTATALGTITLDVVNPAAVRSLDLRVEELNTTAFVDQLPATIVDRSALRLTRRATGE